MSLINLLKLPLNFLIYPFPLLFLYKPEDYVLGKMLLYLIINNAFDIKNGKDYYGVVLSILSFKVSGKNHVLKMFLI